MIKKTIEYEDFDGNKNVEDFYFHLSKAEITELEVSFEGGLTGHLQEIIKSDDGAEIMAAFKKILYASCGRRSEDGKKFIKSEEITEDFVFSNAYDALFMEIVLDAEKAAEFIRGIIPHDVAAAIEADEEGQTPAWETEDRDPTQAELASMSKEQLARAFARKANQNGDDNDDTE